jgi:hypothetical protein
VNKLETMAKQIETKSYSLVEIALLAQAFQKSTQTIERWIAANDDRLTSDKAKNALKKTAA